MLPGLVWTRLVSLREWWEESEQELFAPDVELGPMGAWAHSVGGYAGPATLLGQQPWPWDHFHPGRAGHRCPWLQPVGPVCGCEVPAVPQAGSCAGLGQAVLGGWAPTPALLFSRKYFLLSLDYQLIGSLLKVSFLTLPEFILIRAVVEFFLSLSLHLLLEHGGNGYNVKVKNVYSLL